MNFYFQKTQFALRSSAKKVCWFSFMLAVSACSHLDTPKYESATNEYSGMGEYNSGVGEYKSGLGEFKGPGETATQDEFATPEELYSSDKIKRPDQTEISDKTETPDKTKTAPQTEKKKFKLQWPVDLISISRGYIEGGRKSHLGLDITGRRNTPIRAAHDGLVIYAGSGFRGFGKMIIIEFDNTWATLYGHLNKFKVKTGARVTRGQIIGYMGRTGRATGVHLHFELMKDKTPVDPMRYLTLEEKDIF